MFDMLYRFLVCVLLLVSFSSTAQTKRQTEADTYYYRGLGKLDSCEYKWAVMDFTVSINFDSTRSNVFLARADARYELGDTIGAFLDIENAIALNSKYVWRAFFLRAYLKGDIGDYEGAIEDYTYVIDRLRTRTSWAFNNRGYARLQIGDFENALVDFERAIKRTLGSSTALLNKGITLIKMGDIDEGCKSLRKSKRRGHYISKAWLEKYCQ